MPSYSFGAQWRKGKEGEEQVLAWLREQARDAHPAVTVVDVRGDQSYQKCDIDFLYGDVAIEVKTDYLADKTGNVFLEYEALERSQARLWHILIPQRHWMLICQRDELLSLAHAYKSRATTVYSHSHDGMRHWHVTGVAVSINDVLRKTPAHLVWV